LGYTPKPLDTSAVDLGAELLELTELLARHNHDVWAQKRLDEGWVHGPQRIDSRKEHPCLVAYEELPESEKDYDRAAVVQLLKAIVALGYRITPP
jgi:ryanodine receptor 2